MSDTPKRHAPQRLPKLPRRDEIPAEEVEAYDYMVARMERGFGPTSEIVAGQPYGVPHFSALAATPLVAQAFSRVGNAVMARQDEPGSFSAADHEMVDVVLPLDADYWGLLAGHVPGAIAAGIRVEAIEAIRDAREEQLTDDERDQVEFIRAVRDGTVTDELWARMEARLGSTRGVVEYVCLIGLLMFHVTFCAAVGVPEMEREALAKMLAEFKDGTRPMPMTYKERLAQRPLP